MMKISCPICWQSHTKSNWVLIQIHFLHRRPRKLTFNPNFVLRFLSKIPVEKCASLSHHNSVTRSSLVQTWLPLSYSSHCHKWILSKYKLIFIENVIVSLHHHHPRHHFHWHYFCCRSDFETECPALCECKWRDSKKHADCKSKSYTTIPQNLHNEVQVFT